MTDDTSKTLSDKDIKSIVKNTKLPIPFKDKDGNIIGEVIHLNYTRQS